MNRKFKEFNKFYINVFSVFCVQILIKIVGMIYNLYLTNNEAYSDAGNGIFMSAHQIYILFLTIIQNIFASNYQTTIVPHIMPSALQLLICRLVRQRTETPSAVIW